MDKGQRSSYLSSNVKKLICFQPDCFPHKGCYGYPFFKDGLLNWNAVEEICNLDQCFSQDGVSDYIMAISRLYPVSYQVHASLCQLKTEEFELKYENLLTWTTKSKHLLRCFNLLKSPQSQTGCLVTSLLLLTSTLERLLGDIFLMCSDETVTCPSLLKDLLKMQELRSVLGESFMNCLEVFIGSPCGLNLRNLAWHGFLSDGELPAHYVSFLLMLTISLAETAKAHNEQTHFEKLSERQLIKYSESTVIKDVFQNIELTQTDNSMSKLFSRSHFVTTSMLSLWYLASDFFQQERYEYVVMIMLPQLEHSLRRLYASVNEIPERVQTAESAEFYTTFNEILSPELANGTPNKLLQFLEPCYIELLLDIFVHPESSRLRDHLSHGEVDIFDFPKYLANHVLCIAIAFCLRFCPEDTSGIDCFSGRDCFSELDGHFGQLNNFSEISITVQDYRSIFHPFSCFQRELSTLICSLLEWKNLAQPNEDEFQENCSEDLYDKTAWERIINTILQQTSFAKSSAEMADRYTSQEERSVCDEEVLKIMLSLLDDCELNTLFRPRYELEVILVLRQVAGHCLQTSHQIQQISQARYSEWEQKTLRSRQRNNYKRFWFHLPSVAQTLCLLAVVMGSEFNNINKMTGADVKKNKFLKKCLQCSENLASLSSSSRNRWLECNKVCKIWLDQVSVYYDQHIVWKHHGKLASTKLGKILKVFYSIKTTTSYNLHVLIV